MVGKEEAIEIHHWSNMIISVMSISGGIIEPNRNHSQLGLFCNTSVATNLVGVRSVGFRVPSILAIRNRPICARF